MSSEEHRWRKMEDRMRCIEEALAGDTENGKYILRTYGEDDTKHVTYRLKPCETCGATQVHYVEFYCDTLYSLQTSQDRYNVRCCNVWAHRYPVRTHYYDTEEQAAFAWNNDILKTKAEIAQENEADKAENEKRVEPPLPLCGDCKHWRGRHFCANRVTNSSGCARWAATEESPHREVDAGRGYTAHRLNACECQACMPGMSRTLRGTGIK